MPIPATRVLPPVGFASTSALIARIADAPAQTLDDIRTRGGSLVELGKGRVFRVAYMACPESGIGRVRIRRQLPDDVSLLRQVVLAIVDGLPFTTVGRVQRVLDDPVRMGNQVYAAMASDVQPVLDRLWRADGPLSPSHGPTFATALSDLDVSAALPWLSDGSTFRADNLVSSDVVETPSRATLRLTFRNGDGVPLVIRIHTALPERCGVGGMRGRRKLACLAALADGRRCAGQHGGFAGLADLFANLTAVCVEEQAVAMLYWQTRRRLLTQPGIMPDRAIEFLPLRADGQGQGLPTETASALAMAVARCRAEIRMHAMARRQWEAARLASGPSCAGLVADFTNRALAVVADVTEKHVAAHTAEKLLCRLDDGVGVQSHPASASHAPPGLLAVPDAPCTMVTYRRTPGWSDQVAACLGQRDGASAKTVLAVRHHAASLRPALRMRDGRIPAHMEMARPGSDPADMAALSERVVRGPQDGLMHDLVIRAIHDGMEPVVDALRRHGIDALVTRVAHAVPVASGVAGMAVEYELARQYMHRCEAMLATRQAAHDAWAGREDAEAGSPAAGAFAVCAYAMKQAGSALADARERCSRLAVAYFDAIGLLTRMGNGKERLAVYVRALDLLDSQYDDGVLDAMVTTHMMSLQSRALRAGPDSPPDSANMMAVVREAEVALYELSREVSRTAEPIVAEQVRQASGMHLADDEVAQLAPDLLNFLGRVEERICPHPSRANRTDLAHLMATLEQRWSDATHAAGCRWLDLEMARLPAGEGGDDAFHAMVRLAVVARRDVERYLTATVPVERAVWERIAAAAVGTATLGEYDAWRETEIGCAGSLDAGQFAGHRHVVLKQPMRNEAQARAAGLDGFLRGAIGASNA